MKNSETNAFEIYLGWQTELTRPAGVTTLNGLTPSVVNKVKLAELDIASILGAGWEQDVGSWVVTPTIVETTGFGLFGPFNSFAVPIVFTVEQGAGGVVHSCEVDPGSPVPIASPYVRVLVSWDSYEFSDYLCTAYSQCLVPEKVLVRVTIQRSFSKSREVRRTFLRSVANANLPLDPSSGGSLVNVPQFASCFRLFQSQAPVIDEAFWTGMRLQQQGPLPTGGGNTFVFDELNDTNSMLWRFGRNLCCRPLHPSTRRIVTFPSGVHPFGPISYQFVLSL